MFDAKKDQQGRVFYAYDIMCGKRLKSLSLPDRVDWVNANYYNTARGYIIRTFTYYWLYRLWLSGQNEFTDEGWQESLHLYFDNK